MKRVIRATVTFVTGNMLFDSAYPAADKLEFETFYRKAFVKCAKAMNYFEIVKRFRRDDELVKLGARVVSIVSCS